MSTFVTRRAAFGIAATAALASLTACASDIRPLLSSGPGDYEFFFILEYQDGAWTVRNEPAKLTTSSPSSSASSSGASV